MERTNCENCRNTFKEYASLIKREGFSDLLKWLEEKSDFFTAPASTKYHSNFEGGLCFHTIKVFEQMMTELPRIKTFYPDLTDDEVVEKIAIVSLLHDICKTSMYTLSTRNVKNEETGKWEKVPCYTIDDKVPFGHGEKSVILAQAFTRLKADEIGAILAHMGDFSDTKTGLIFDKYHLAVELHIADLRASRYDEEAV